MANWVKPQAGALTEEAATECADFILGWLRSRNGEELADALDEMRVKDSRLMREELIYILQAGGKPDNWTAR
jgi:hypothetical protein